MSLYNLICGHNTTAAIIVSAYLGYDVSKKIPRYRDTFLETDDDGNLTGTFGIYTRMGGGNYECWKEDETDYSSQETILKHEEECDCPYHQLLKIENESWFERAEDDDFDCTYRTLYGKFNDDFLERVKQVFKSNSYAPIKEEIEKLTDKTEKENGN